MNLELLNRLSKERGDLQRRRLYAEGGEEQQQPTSRLYGMQGNIGVGNLNQTNQQLGYYQGNQLNGGSAAVRDVMYDDNGEPIVVNPYLLDEVTVRPSREDKRVLRKIRDVMPDYNSRMVLYNAYGNIPQKEYKPDLNNKIEKFFDTYEDSEAYADSLNNKYNGNYDYSLHRNKDGTYNLSGSPLIETGGYVDNDIALNDYVDRAADIIQKANGRFANFTIKHSPSTIAKYIAKPLGVDHGMGTFRAHYNGLTNTAHNIYGADGLEAELSHPIESKYNNRSSSSWRNRVIGALLDEQDKTYSDPDNFEMHTHSVVEPIIRSYIRQEPLINKRTGRRFIPQLKNIPGLISSEAAALKLKREPQIQIDQNFDRNSDNSDIIY